MLEAKKQQFLVGMRRRLGLARPALRVERRVLARLEAAGHGMQRRRKLPEPVRQFAVPHAPGHIPDLVGHNPPFACHGRRA